MVEPGTPGEGIDPVELARQAFGALFEEVSFTWNIWGFLLS